MSTGHFRFKATTTEPKPKLTNIIGKAQQINVPDETNKAKVLKNKEFLLESITCRQSLDEINFKQVCALEDYQNWDHY